MLHIRQNKYTLESAVFILVNVVGCADLCSTLGVEIFCDLLNSPGGKHHEC